MEKESEGGPAKDNAFSGLWPHFQWKQSTWLKEDQDYAVAPTIFWVHTTIKTKKKHYTKILCLTKTCCTWSVFLKVIS